MDYFPRALLVSSTQVQCLFPTSPLDRMSTDAWYVWSVYISNDNVTFSTPAQTVVVYDARCAQCTGTACSQKVALPILLLVLCLQLIRFIFAYGPMYKMLIPGSYFGNFVSLRKLLFTASWVRDCQHCGVVARNSGSRLLLIRISAFLRIFWHAKRGRFPEFGSYIWGKLIGSLLKFFRLAILDSIT